MPAKSHNMIEQCIAEDITPHTQKLAKKHFYLYL